MTFWLMAVIHSMRRNRITVSLSIEKAEEDIHANYRKKGETGLTGKVMALGTATLNLLQRILLRN
jgi:hypothetical protein